MPDFASFSGVLESSIRTFFTMALYGFFFFLCVCGVGGIGVVIRSALIKSIINCIYPLKIKIIANKSNCVCVICKENIYQSCHYTAIYKGKRISMDKMYLENSGGHRPRCYGKTAQSKLPKTWECFILERAEGVTIYCMGISPRRARRCTHRPGVCFPKASLANYGC